MFDGYRVSVWDDKKILEIDSGDGYTHCECHRIVHLKVVKMVNFV